MLHHVSKVNLIKRVYLTCSVLFVAHL